MMPSMKIWGDQLFLDQPLIHSFIHSSHPMIQRMPQPHTGTAAAAPPPPPPPASRTSPPTIIIIIQRSFCWCMGASSSAVAGGPLPPPPRTNDNAPPPLSRDDEPVSSHDRGPRRRSATITSAAAAGPRVLLRVLAAALLAGGAAASGGGGEGDLAAHLPDTPLAKALLWILVVCLVLLSGAFLSCRMAAARTGLGPQGVFGHARGLGRRAGRSGGERIFVQWVD